MSQKFLLWACLLMGLLCWVLPQQARATHQMGVDVYYDCIDPATNTYRVTVRLYAECATSGESLICSFSPTFLQFQAVNPSVLCGAPVLVQPWARQPVQRQLPNCAIGTNLNCPAPVTQFCIDGCPDRCSNPSSPIGGVSEAVFVAIVRIPAGCHYRLAYNDCCRNPGITNITNPSSGYVTTYNEFNFGANLLGPGACNSSPRFVERPIPQYCLGQPITFTQTAQDPDGDSLSFRLGPCFCGTAAGQTQCNLVPPATWENPIAPDLFVLDPVTGTITMQPTRVGRTIMCVYVDEWRNINGTMTRIGTVIRDIQLLVQDCSGIQAFCATFTNAPITFTPPKIVAVNGDPIVATVNLYREEVCIGQQVEIVLTAGDDNPGAVQIMSLENTLPGVTFQTVNTPIPNPNGTFRWVPTQSGTFNFTVKVQAGCCSPKPPRQFILQIVVAEPIQANPTIVQNCNSVDFRANISGGAPPFIVEWGGPGGLDFNPTNTQQNLSHTYPGPGTYPYTLTIRHQGACDTVITGQVVVGQNAASFTPGQSVTLCSRYTYQLGGTQNLTPPLPQTYVWTPSTFLDDPTAPLPNVTPINTGGSIDSIYYRVEVSNGICTATDSVLVVVQPIVDAQMTGTFSVCAGDTVTLSGPSGVTGYLWSTGDTSRVIRFVGTQTVTISLSVVGFNGCLSQPVTRVVTVNAIPQARVFGDTIACAGETVTLTALGGQSYFWSTGGTDPIVTITPTQDTTLYVIPYANFCLGDTAFITVRYFENPEAELLLLSDSIQCQAQSSYDFEANVLTPGSHSFYWNFDNGANPRVSANGAVSGVNYLTPGIKTVKLVVTDLASGCQTDTLTQVIEVRQTPIANFNVPTLQCFVGNSYDFTYTGTTAGQFVWDFGPATSTDENPSGVVFPAPGDYTVRLIAGLAGCQDTVDKVVTVLPNPPAPTTVNDTACKGFPVTLLVSAPANARFAWYTAATGGAPVHTGNSLNIPNLERTTHFFIEATSTVNGCPSTRTRITALMLPVPNSSFTATETDLEIPTAVAEFRSMRDSSIVYWFWNFGDGDTSVLGNPVHQYLDPGEYTVTLTVVDTNNCSSTTIRQNYIKVEENIVLAFASAFTPNGAGPVENEFFSAHTRLINSLTVEIYDRQGKVIYSSSDISFRWDGTINGVPAPEGVYTYVVEAQAFNGVRVRRAGSVTLLR